MYFTRNQFPQSNLLTHQILHTGKMYAISVYFYLVKRYEANPRVCPYRCLFGVKTIHTICQCHIPFSYKMFHKKVTVKEVLLKK